MFEYCDLSIYLDEKIFIFGDVRQFEIVFGNLICNVFELMVDGGILIIEFFQVVVFCKVVVVVVDEGKGMEFEIFE